MRTILIIIGILLFINILIVTVSKTFANEGNLKLPQSTAVENIKSR